jgi:hypothetical protein
MDFREVLGAEFERRATRSRSYSLRAFARDLRTHHATLSRILGQRQRITGRTIQIVGPRIGLNAADVSEACIAANADWIAHFIGERRATADSRRLAMLSGLPIDDVNVALHHLLYHGRLTMKTASRWELTNL